jgi:hypothetical protein
MLWIQARVRAMMAASSLVSMSVLSLGERKEGQEDE